MMRNSGGASFSQNRCGFVSWCVDSAEPQPHPTAPTDTSGESKEAAFSHQEPKTPFIQQKALKTHRNATHSCTLPRKTPVQRVEGEDDGSILTSRDGNFRISEAETQSKQEPSVSIPNISRRARPISWNRGEPRASTPSSMDDPSPPTGSWFGQHGSLPVSSMTDQDPLSAQVDDRQQSISSNVNNLLGDLHLSHQAKLVMDEAQRGRSLNSCSIPDIADLSTSTLPNIERSGSSILDFPADIFKTSCELEKENAHFVVVDMVLAVLEGVKCTLSFDQWAFKMDKQHTQDHLCTKRQTCSAEGSPSQTQEHEHGCNRGGPQRDSCKWKHSDEVTRTPQADSQPFPALKHKWRKEEEDQAKCLSILSADSGFEEGDVNTAVMPTHSLRNAEWLAQQLVLEFKRKWLPSLRRGRQSLRSSLQELPGTGRVEVRSGSLSEEIRIRTRKRGSLTWAPPCFQLIFTIQPPHRRSEMVALQGHMCAGCGTEVEPRYIKKLRYCEYLGRYFCDCCHSGSEAVIPGRVLSSWDFSKYPVSDFSKQLLDSVWYQPLFDLSCVGKSLFNRVKELEKFRELKERLLCIRKLLKACRLSTRVLAEFEHLPVYLLEQPLLFSMDDLQRVKKGQLVSQARAVLQASIKHVENCELCLARGFICEFCREKDIIFPFQTDICKRCKVCRACFHKHCFAEKKCPKCIRLRSRQKVQMQVTDASEHY